MKALIDGDILKFEAGFGAETGWRSMHPNEPDELPPWDYVRDMLHKKVDDIVTGSRADGYSLYLTEGKNFRYDIAKRKPYKGTRKENKPFHYHNLAAYMKYELKAEIANGIEADDLMTIHHTADTGTIVCSRDKDLRTVPGWFYSWENYNQPSFGPELITKEGWIRLGPKRDKIVGTGLSFFYSQMLTGDTADNIPGLPNTGPVAAFEMLQGRTPAEQLEVVVEAYEDHYGADVAWAKNGNDYVKAHTELLEQGRLCWLVRRLNEDGSPVLWEIGMEE